MTPLAAPIRAPSDLGAVSDAHFKLGGRVVYVDARQLVIADAFSQAALWLSPELATQVEAGDLIVVSVQAREHELAAVHVDWRSAHDEPTQTSEFGRVTLASRGAGLAGRSKAKRVIHRYFEEQGFVEVDTPGLARCPGLDAHVNSWRGVRRSDHELFLITSPELHMKRLLSAGLPRIYQICRCFRAEEHGPWHEPEFTMLEWYRAFADWESTLLDTEAIMRRAAEVISDESTRRLLEAPFERITVRDAFASFGGISDALDLANTNEELYYRTMVEHVEPALSVFPRPIFLTHYPLVQAGLARACSDEPRAAERYELYFRGRELCNGFSELTDAVEQRRRFLEELERRSRAAEPTYPIDETFLSALAQGLPPCSGNALGFDRMVAVLQDAGSLRSVFAFTDDER